MGMLAEILLMLTRSDRVDAPSASGTLRTGWNSDFSSPLGFLN